MPRPARRTARRPALSRPARRPALSRPHLAAGLLAGLALSLGLGSLWSPAAEDPAPRPRVAAPPAAAVTAPAWAWRAGERYRYRFQLETAQGLRRTTGPGQTVAVDGALELAGALRLDCLARRAAGGFVLALTVERLDAHRLRLLDQEADPRAVVDQTAWLVLEADGQISAVHLAPEAPALARHLLQGLAGQLEWILRPTATWSSAHARPFALADDTYRATPTGATRQRRFTRLAALPEADPEGDGAGTLSVSDGVLATLTTSEAVRGQTADGHARGEARLALQLVARGPGPQEPAALARLQGLPRLDLAAATPSPEASARALAARIDGLTADALVADLLRFAAGGRLPDHNRWLWRATGLLMQDPTLCETLERVFGEPALGAAGRGLIADLLAGAGHSEAQASLRRLLAGPAAADPERGLLLQRFSQVSAPTPETLDWLGAEHRDGATPLPAAFALGAALERAADPAQAAALRAQLLEAAEQAEGETRGQLLRALGNTGHPAAAQAAARAATDADPAVRAGAAVALRISRAPEDQAALVALAGDADFRVAGAALDSLVELADAGALSLEARAALDAAPLHPQGAERIRRLRPALAAR